VLEMLNGAAQIGAGAVFLVVGVLLELTGTFRGMTEDEKREARLCFGESLPYDNVHISIGSWLADLSSANAPNAIGTMRVVHFPTGTDLHYEDDGVSGNFDWLMHELTHVWQGETTGPFYMADALISQQTEGYSYQGDHASPEAALIAADQAGETFADFNPEQQGDIVKDYYRRLKQGDSVDAWEPFVSALVAA
jgi:hypothetical protein